MSLTNAFSVQLKSGDLNISDGTNSLTFHYQEKTTMVEGRGSTFTDNLNSGGTTYKDATPFARAVFDNWIGGIGQASYNKTFGGSGVGGDETRYLDGDVDTVHKTGYMLPGMARNLVYNTVGGQATPISDGVDPLAGDEQEVPRGVLPLSGYAAGSTNFVAAGTPTIASVRVLCLFTTTGPSGSITVSGTLKQVSNGAVLGVYQTTLSIPTLATYTGWKWVTLPRASGTGVLANGVQYSFTAGGSGTNIIGGYVASIGGVDAFQCYFQLMTGATPSKYWAGSPVRFEQLLSGSTYVNVAITSGAIFNTAATGTAGTAGTSPERTLAGAAQSTVVFNSSLYVFSAAGVEVWTAAAAAANSAPTSSSLLVQGWSPVAYGGFIYFISSSLLGVYKWDGTFPPVGVQVIGDNKIGQAGSRINALFVLGGFLHVVKPEGIFQIYQQPDKIDLVETPQINKVVTFPTAHLDTGRWFVIHQEMFFCNYRDAIYQCAFNSASGTQVSVLKPELPRYRLNYFHYVNGLTSDGRNVYASWNNLGVYALSGQSWHKMFEFYEQVNLEGQGSGLRWLPDPVAAPDYLFCGDGRTLVKMPIPNAYGAITNQIFANNTNKCGYWVSSAWDGDVAEILKYVHAIDIRGVPNGFNFKLVAAVWQSGTTPTLTTLLESTIMEGLSRDNWIAPNAPTGATMNAVITQKVSGGAQLPNTAAPGCWVSTDFNNQYYTAEKLAFTTTDTTTVPPTTDILANPVKLAQTYFILYFYNPTAGQQNTVGQEIMAVDSIAVKYLPLLDYIPTYQCTLDFSSLIDENMSSDTTATLGTYVAQLRAWGGRHSPITIQFWDGYSTSNGVVGVKTVNVLLRDIRFEYDPVVTRDEGGDPIPKRAFLSMIGIDAEYAGT